MCASRRVLHPSGSPITFDPKWHQYSLGRTRLQSVSKLLDRYFPFDKERVLGLVSRKTGEPVAAIEAKWSRQALLGKNVHAYIESRLLDQPPPPFVRLLGPAGALSKGDAAAAEAVLHGEEAAYMAVADAAVAAVRARYDVLAVEQVVACPAWGLAGTIDFVGRNKRTGRLLIGDWKTSGSTTTNFRFGSFETPCGGCLAHLPNNKSYRYALQVIAYGEILRRERYVETGYFDAALRAAEERQQEKGQDATADAGGTAAAAAPAKRKKGKKGKGTGEAQAQAQAPPPAAAPLTIVAGGEFEYGIVQMAKDEEGGVTVEYKAPTEAAVLPPDIPEMSFAQLLRDVMDQK